MQFAVEIVVRGIDYPTFRRVYYSEEFNQQVAQAIKLKERFQVEHVVGARTRLDVVRHGAQPHPAVWGRVRGRAGQQRGDGERGHGENPEAGAGGTGGGRGHRHSPGEDSKRINGTDWLYES